MPDALVRRTLFVLLAAATVAAALHPLYERLARRLRGQREIAAAIATVGVLVMLLAPLSFLGAFLVRQVAAGVAFLTELSRSEGTAGAIAKLPEALRGPAASLAREFPALVEQARERLGAQIGATGTKAAAMVGGAISAGGAAVVQVVLALIALYFLLVDGPALVRWIERTSPLGGGRTRALLAEVRKVSVSVLTSTLLTAAIQALAALLGFLIARVPEAAFFTLLTFLLAFVPSVGAASACFVAAAVLLVGGRPAAAAFVAAWGVLVVGLVDNLAKPLLMKGGMQLHGAVVFFALIGGLAAFGPVGLLVGPLAIAFFLAVVRIADEERDRTAAP